MEFLKGRYVSSCEAIWCIFRFVVHNKYPCVKKLDVHLENGKRLFFDPHLLERFQRPVLTTLTAWFMLNRQDEFARNLKYIEIPAHYIRQTKDSYFTRRRYVYFYN